MEVSGKKMITRKMWFLSVHIPTKEQTEDARNMSYELIHVKTPEIQKDSKISEMVMNLLKTISWQPQDAFVIMGEPRWVAVFAWLYCQSTMYLDGCPDIWIESSCPPEMMEKGGFCDNANTGGKVMYPARFMNLMTTFTERNSVEIVENGQRIKKSIFKHGGFVPLFDFQSSFYKDSL